MSDLQADGLPIHAALVLNKVLEKGRGQGHAKDAWKNEEELKHALKSIRHMCTFLLQELGHEKADRENHEELAFTRAGMTCYVANEKKRRRQSSKSG